MKKLSIFAVAFAAMILASCGGNKTNQAPVSEDTVKSFEQEQIEANIKLQFDSLASELSKLKQLPVVMKNGVVKLSDEEKKVKPDYLLPLDVADKAMTLAEKYRALSALQVDKEVAKLYDMPVEDYDKAIAKLAADINDPSFKAIENTDNLFEASQVLYDAMNDNGRINYFWQIVAASLVEQLYVTSQNTEKFLAAFDDDAAANVTFRIVLLQDALNRLTEYDPEVVPVAEAISPLSVLNAVTVSELKSQMEEANELTVTSRNTLLK